MTELATTVLDPSVDAEQFAVDQRRAVALMSSVWVPDHLRSKNPNETIATCTSIVQMARKWRMNAEQVAAATYSVRGKVGFEGKMYAALAIAHGNLDGGLRIIYSGEGAKMAAVVFGSSSPLTEKDKELLRDFVATGNSSSATDLELSGVRCVRLSVAECATEQAMWKKDPQQKIFYTGATKWCRRYLPDLVMGVVSVEDLERIEWERNQNRPTIENVTAAITAEPPIDVTTEPDQDPKTEEASGVDAQTKSDASENPDAEPVDDEAGKIVETFYKELASCKRKGELEGLRDELDTSPDWESLRARPALFKECVTQIERAITRAKAQ